MSQYVSTHSYYDPTSGLPNASPADVFREQQVRIETQREAQYQKTKYSNALTYLSIALGFYSWRLPDSSGMKQPLMLGSMGLFALSIVAK
jgi:hypothetical protein